jgi:hypothetical protein
VSDLICLHCEQPLALIQRLSGDVEFCSKEHRRLYFQERERLALERLLAAAPKRPARGNPADAPAPAPPVVEEPFEIEDLTVISLDALALQANRREEPPARKAEPAKATKAEPAKAAKAEPAKAAKAEPAKPPRADRKAQVKKAAPDPAGFAQSNGIEPRASAPAPRNDPPGEAIGLKPAPQSRPANLDSMVVFLSPGLFLPWRKPYVALSERELASSTRLDPVAFPLRPHQMRLIEERLRRPDRVGFGPS